MPWPMPDAEPSPARIVRLFRNGRNQALRIPRDMELPGNTATIHKDGDRLLIQPAAPPSLLAWLAAATPLDDTFPEIDDPSPESVDL